MVRKLCQELNMMPKQVYDMTYIASLNWMSMFYMESKYKEKMKSSNGYN